ncbi:MAG: hypothetical protein HY673_00610 [Chloroflexi bacterium]|nr:hypothetical protein [Chloroflexota bacterium]
MESANAVGQSPVPRKHSGFGTASFIISMVMGIFLAGDLLVAGILVARKTPDDSLALIIVGLFMFVAMFGCLVGVGLGIAGVVDRTRRKVFSVLGLILNSALILVIATVLIVGLAAKK